VSQLILDVAQAAAKLTSTAAELGGEIDQAFEEIRIITEDTVRNRVRGLLRALGVHSRLQAAVEARRRGLVA
jgi:hypothetical protein